jgi:hypothetical protein
MTVTEFALLWIAVTMTGLLIVLVLGFLRVNGLAGRLEKAAGRLESISDRTEPVLDRLQEVGAGTRDVVRDLQAISTELRTAVQWVGLSRRTRASVAGAKAAVEAVIRHANGHQTH